jgi:hypothetical protein
MRSSGGNCYVRDPNILPESKELLAPLPHGSILAPPLQESLLYHYYPIINNPAQEPEYAAQWTLLRAAYRRARPHGSMSLQSPICGQHDRDPRMTKDLPQDLQVLARLQQSFTKACRRS